MNLHGKTFRKMIKKIVTRKNDKRPFFLGINTERMTGGHIFTIALNVEQEAHNMIAHFWSYLTFKYGPEIYGYMQKESPESVKQSPWDLESHMAKTKEDKLIRNLVVIVEGMDWLKNQERTNSELNKALCKRTVKFWFDNDIFTALRKQIKNDTDWSNTSLSITTSDDATSTLSEGLSTDDHLIHQENSKTNNKIQKDSNSDTLLQSKNQDE